MTDFAAYLNQTTTYRANDRVYYVAELTADQLGDALATLNRYAVELYWSVYRRTVFADDVTDDAARDWLHDRPLYQRLLAEQRRRTTTTTRENDFSG